MKHQYFGDERDYFKYGILKGLTKNSQLKLGVCWMLTPPDPRRHGAKRDYLCQSERWSHYDKDLFIGLSGCLSNGDKPNVSMAARSGVLPEAIFFDGKLPDDLRKRNSWQQRCGQKLMECDLIFFDPDTGIRSTTDLGNREPREYLFWEEVSEFYRKGHSIIGFQYSQIHFDKQLALKRKEQMERVAGHKPAIVFVTNHVIFPMACQPHHAEAFHQAADRIVKEWHPKIQLV